MDLNLFENRNKQNNFIDKFMEELKSALEDTIGKMQNKKENNNVLDEYNRYERQKIFLDNKSRKGNDLAWVMDDKSVCLSEHGDGGPYSVAEINLPQSAKVGEVYKKIDNKYVYNPDITMELNKIM